MAQIRSSRLFTLVACAVIMLMAQAGAHAQRYPERPIRLIVPFQPGGAVDTTARIVSQQLALNLNQPVIVENRVGAGGTLGTNLVAKASPDGYTILFGVLGPIGLAPTLYSKLAYDPATDFAAVTLIASYPNTLLINRGAPFKSVKELIAIARAKPGALTYATGGSGTILHLSAELFSKMANIKLVHIPYKGGLEAMPDLLAGRVPMLFANIGLSLPHIGSEKLAVLAVTSATRVALLPNTPTLAEVGGLPGYETNDWFGILAPAAIPQPVVAQLHREITKVLQAPEITTKLTEQGAQLLTKTPAEFASFVRSEIIKWAEVIKFSGARLD